MKVDTSMLNTINGLSDEACPPDSISEEVASIAGAQVKLLRALAQFAVRQLGEHQTAPKEP